MIKILETGKCSAKTISCLRKSFYIRGPAFQTVEDGVEHERELAVGGHECFEQRLLTYHDHAARSPKWPGLSARPSVHPPKRRLEIRSQGLHLSR